MDMKADKDQYKKFIFFIEVIVLAIIFTVIFAGIWYSDLSKHIAVTFFRRGHWAVIAGYGVLFLVLAKLFGGFKISVARKTDMIFSYIATVVITNLVMYFVTVGLTLEYNHVPLFCMLVIIELAMVIIWIFAITAINNSIYPPHNMLLIHGDYQQKDVILTMNRKSNRYNIARSVNINEGKEKIIPLIELYDSVVISDVPAQERNDVLKYCYDHSKRIYMLPKVTDIIIRSADEIHIFDTPVLLARNYGLNFSQKVLKRTLDIIVSSIGIIILAIPMCIIAVIIKLDDHGPVFFKQKRVTRDGKLFDIIKFRSMSENAEEHGARLAKKDDDRITKSGKVLRRTHLDEIPQLFNVFKGEMSMVGPRPERPEIMEKYMDSIEEFKYRLKVKGGITGYAQVYGKYNTTPYNKLRLDLTYIQNYTIFLDIKVLVLTFKIVFRKETSEGVDADQDTALKNQVERKDNIY